MAKLECCWKCPYQWSEWSEWLAAGLHARNRWRLPVLFLGILFASGRRTVTTWLRAAGVSDDFQDYYYFLISVGRKTNFVATRLVLLLIRVLSLPERLLLVIDDSPTKRYGPKVEGADVHHNPTPGPADQPFLYGHIWVTISLTLRHPRWGAIGLPLRAMLYVRKRTMEMIPKVRNWHRFATKLQLAARLVEWVVPILKKAGKTVWIVVDGGYTKRPFLRRVLKIPDVVIIGRLRKDAALCDLPPKRKKGQPRGRGRPRKYGKNRLSLVKRAGHRGGWETIECVLYNQTVTKTYKTFLATYVPVGGVIRVVLVKEVRLLLDRSQCYGEGNPRSVCRSSHHRTRLPRRKGSLGHRPATGTQHLDQCGRLSFEFVDAYASRALGLGPARQDTLRPQRLAMGRRPTTPFSRRSPQSLAA
ncbi:MAG: transposase, partial [Pirellulales bacterium]|nr:transposase [Pirellulales bacterium]